jgi:hypothetical protein
VLLNGPVSGHRAQSRSARRAHPCPTSGSSQTSRRGPLQRIRLGRSPLCQFPELILYLPQFRESALARLREDEVPIRRHLESTASAGNQAQALDSVAELVQKLLRRPGGSKEVVSRHAILNLDAQLLGHISPPLVHLGQPDCGYASLAGQPLQLSVDRRGAAACAGRGLTAVPQSRVSS